MQGWFYEVNKVEIGKIRSKYTVKKKEKRKNRNGQIQIFGRRKKIIPVSTTAVRPMEKFQSDNDDIIIQKPTKIAFEEDNMHCNDWYNP